MTWHWSYKRTKLAIERGPHIVGNHGWWGWCYCMIVKPLRGCWSARPFRVQTTNQKKTSEILRSSSIFFWVPKIMTAELSLFVVWFGDFFGRFCFSVRKCHCFFLGRIPTWPWSFGFSSLSTGGWRDLPNKQLLPSGKRLHNYGKSPFLTGKPSISIDHFP